MIRKVELLAFSSRPFGSIIEGSSPSRRTKNNLIIVSDENVNFVFFKKGRI